MCFFQTDLQTTKLASSHSKHYSLSVTVLSLSWVFRLVEETDYVFMGKKACTFSLPRKHCHSF